MFSNTSDAEFAQGLSNISKGLDCIALAIDASAEAKVLSATAAGAAAGPEAAGAAWLTAQVSVQPVIAAGNLFATAATAFSVSSDLITGNTRLSAYASYSNSTGLSYGGDLTLSVSTMAGIALTGEGWLPMPAEASVLLQSGAVVNDFFGEAAYKSILGSNTGTFSFQHSKDKNDFKFTPKE